MKKAPAVLVVVACLLSGGAASAFPAVGDSAAAYDSRIDHITAKA
jgi:hypothetical protein